MTLLRLKEANFDVVKFWLGSEILGKKIYKLFIHPAGTTVRNICYEPKLDNFSLQIPINQSNHTSGTRDNIGMRQVAKRQHRPIPMNEVPTNSVSTKFANTCATSFKRTAHLKSFLNSVTQCSNSGPSIAGKASSSISSGVSGSSSFIGTEHCKRNQNGRQLVNTYDNNSRHDIRRKTRLDKTATNCNELNLFLNV